MPTRANIGGAVLSGPRRVTFIRRVADSLEQTDSDIRDAQLDGKPELDSKGRPFPVFVALLLANGWFIRPVPFLLTNSKLSALQRIKRAARRIPIFLRCLGCGFFDLTYKLGGARVMIVVDGPRSTTLCP